MTRPWQLMRDAQIFLEASRLANNALIGINFMKIARSRGISPSVDIMNKIDDGVKLLTEMLKTLEAREKWEKVSSEAISVLYAISQGRLVRDQIALKHMIANSIDELQRFKRGEIEVPEETEDLLEIIANATAEEATRASSKIRIFMPETS